MGTCPSCERCTWNPGPDCGKPEHPHCEGCGHCRYRHADQSSWQPNAQALKQRNAAASPPGDGLIAREGGR